MGAAPAIRERNCPGRAALELVRPSDPFLGSSRPAQCPDDRSWRQHSVLSFMHEQGSLHRCTHRVRFMGGTMGGAPARWKMLDISTEISDGRSADGQALDGEY